MRHCNDRASVNSPPDHRNASFAGANLRGRAQGALLHGLAGHEMTSETQGVDRHIALQLIHTLMQRVSTFGVDKPRPLRAGDHWSLDNQSDASC